MSKIRIVNWLLTRRCNLDCGYCAIVKNYDKKPFLYPDIKHYIKNEMSTKTVIDTLKKIKEHNPDAFHIFYGGEPLLRKDLSSIIRYCNENQIYYTIISNNTPEIQPLIEKLFNDVGYIEGFTSSVDPVFNELGLNEDRVIKSIEGLKRLKEIQANGLVKDVVAEITVMNHNQQYLTNLIEQLSKEEIYSDITFVDIAKTYAYDFSNIRDKKDLVNPSWELALVFQELLRSKYLIHMKDVLLPMMFNTLPSNNNCELEKGIHNITIDADGTIRLCLRIRGVLTPKYNTVENLFDENGISKQLIEYITIDKYEYCKLCNHSCLMMSKHIDENDGGGTADLVHKDKREE